MIKLLDCTLRDGGFVNDWEFGYSSIRSIVSRLDRANIEIIEIGFIDDRREYDKNRSIFPDTASIDLTLSKLDIKQAMLVGMIDYGTCGLENVSLCADSILNGIRVIFKKKDADNALEYCSELKERGYQLFLNPVSITSYTDKEVLVLIEKINALRPYAMTIVDTYGLMLRREILHYIDLTDRNLIEDATLAYHSHNNQQMAFSNCCAIYDYGAKHNIVLDATLYGMGKSAGNANIELVASFINRMQNSQYSTEQLLDCIYTDIMRIYKNKPWGYNLHYYISALNDCHPSYIKYMLEKNTLSIQSINDIVSKIPPTQKLTYSQQLIENLYLEHQTVKIGDAETISLLRDNLNTDKPIMLLFPGASALQYLKEVKDYVDTNMPVVVSINFIPSFLDVDYVIVANRKRYDQLNDRFFECDNPPIIIAASNILESAVPITHRVNYEMLISSEPLIVDNGAVICINLMKRLGVKNAAVVGMDGFAADMKPNFSDKYMNLYESNEKLQEVNKELKAFIQEAQNDISLVFITPSIFEYKRPS